MRITPFLLTTLVCLCVMNVKSFAQAVSPTASILDSASYHARVLHQEKEYQQLELFTGAVYDGYLRSIKGSPYFFSGDFAPINLKFRGVPYFDIPALYDKYIKTLIIKHYNGFTSLQLENEGIESFEINGHEFRHFRSGEIENLDQGIYRYLAKGQFTALTLDAVELNEKVAMTVEKEFLPKNEYYIIEGGKAYMIERKKDLLRTLNINSKELRQIGKENDYKWKRNKEKLIQITTEIKNK
ncbi:hypothetical protein [Gynurincola endophyticus]|uniref:hypothetical protein n=1 Tax=Gynurincola endophyticus TaxID=2479004 RepID=UPI000F8CD2A9|nr:hypothetical protein [Gynurincola endophyticus]